MWGKKGGGGGGERYEEGKLWKRGIKREQASERRRRVCVWGGGVKEREKEQEV